MNSENKYLETGSNPYYLNQNNTAKEFSSDESTNPQYGFMSTLSQYIIIEQGFKIEPGITIEDNQISFK